MKLAALDLGLTNTDVLWGTPARWRTQRLDSPELSAPEQVRALLDTFPSRPQNLAVTGGRYRDLPVEMDGMRFWPISEVTAIGLGGLAISGLSEALVVSAGSGTAMVAADPEHQFRHATGSAVGGGTLQGMGRLLLGTADAPAIDRLALKGDANAADLTLGESIGGRVGKLPSNASAVNFGKLSRREIQLSTADTAAALVRLVGQVIAVIAINAANANSLRHIVMIGHLVDLKSIRQVLKEVASYYDASIIVPEHPGMGTAVGAWLAAEKKINLAR